MRPPPGFQSWESVCGTRHVNEILFPHRITKDEAKTPSSPGHDHCKCRLALGPHPLGLGPGWVTHQIPHSLVLSRQFFVMKQLM